ncbi:hypothetical protein TNCV_3232691 [Trichonephila clavipes]|nr:hypothetical protein TNCV_3232691 [Trichonephila clavipes]
MIRWSRVRDLNYLAMATHRDISWEEQIHKNEQIQFILYEAGHVCSRPRMSRVHEGGFSRRFLTGVGLSESVRCHGPGLALLTNGSVQQQQQHKY